MKKIIGVCLFVAMSLGMAGCRSAVSSTERAEPLGTPSLIQETRVQPDKTLRGKIGIVQVNEGAASGMTRVQVVLLNQKTYALDVNYVFEWFDENGMMVNSKAAWKTLSFAGSEKKAISEVAPTPSAVDFIVKLQEPRPFLKRNKLNPFKP